MNKYRVNIKKDENFGKKYEDLLQDYFNDNQDIHGIIKKTKNRFNVVDYINDEWVCELKSRRYSIHSFASFMVGENKLREAEAEYKKENHKKFRFYFILKEGVYYWDYKPNPPEDSEEEIFYYFDMGGRTDRGRDERKMTGYIFTDNLIKLTDSIHT